VAESGGYSDYSALRRVTSGLTRWFKAAGYTAHVQYIFQHPAVFAKNATPPKHQMLNIF
jgi:hypothetical protein